MKKSEVAMLARKHDANLAAVSMMLQKRTGDKNNEVEEILSQIESMFRGLVASGCLAIIAATLPFIKFGDGFNEYLAAFLGICAGIVLWASVIDLLKSSKLLVVVNLVVKTFPPSDQTPEGIMEHVRNLSADDVVAFLKKEAQKVDELQRAVRSPWDKEKELAAKSARGALVQKVETFTMLYNIPKEVGHYFPKG